MSGAQVHGKPPPCVYDEHTQWWEPERVGHDGLLTESQKQRWIDDGFIAIDGLFPEEMMEAARAEAEDYFPEGGKEAAHSNAYIGGGADLAKDEQPVDRWGKPWPAYLHRTGKETSNLPMLVVLVGNF